MYLKQQAENQDDDKDGGRGCKTDEEIPDGAAEVASAPEELEEAVVWWGRMTMNNSNSHVCMEPFTQINAQRVAQPFCSLYDFFF